MTVGRAPDQFWRGTTLLFESTSVLWPGFEPTAFDVSVKDTAGPVNEVRQFNFTVQPNESFYVWPRLVATADQTGEVDAFSTLSASFTNTASLAPAATAVPEPAAVWLLACGLALLAARRCSARSTIR